VSNFDRFSLGGTLRFPVTGDAKRSEMSQPYGSMPASPTVDSELRPTVHLSQHARRFRPREIRVTDTPGMLFGIFFLLLSA